MKAITIFQPWASLLACGAKKYETRSWKTDYRGKIAIHAGKAMPYNPYLLENDNYDTPFVLALSRNGYSEVHDLPLGCIIATAELTECYFIRKIKSRNMGNNYWTETILWRNASLPDCREPLKVTGDELLFGDFTPGRYAWEFVNIEMLPEPIPIKGKQRLWNWEDFR